MAVKISGMMGTGSMGHNNRKFITENVDPARTEQNITLRRENLKQVYHELFDEALAEYNAKKTKTRDKIPDYYRHIEKSKQERLFHEVIFQIGNKDNCGCETPEGERAAAALKEFAEAFQERNPHLRVFNSVIHMDEATPHIHIDFVPVAEQSGIIVQIGEWVMRTAAQQAAQWLAQGHQGFRMAVNLSVRQFAGNDLPRLVQEVLRDTGLPPHMLELEVTESMALQNVASTLSTLHACKALGVKLAMDDFGTGYSSLAYLKLYPLDALKIDQAFVRNITQDLGDAAITRAIVAMAHSFGMTVIAEGVETVAQLEFLKALGCEDFQGFLFSKPVPAENAVLCFSGYRG